MKPQTRIQSWSANNIIYLSCGNTCGCSAMKYCCSMLPRKRPHHAWQPQTRTRNRPVYICIFFEPCTHKCLNKSSHSAGVTLVYRDTGGCDTAGKVMLITQSSRSSQSTLKRSVEAVCSTLALSSGVSSDSRDCVPHTPRAFWRRPIARWATFSCSCKLMHSWYAW